MGGLKSLQKSTKIFLLSILIFSFLFSLILNSFESQHKFTSEGHDSNKCAVCLLIEAVILAHQSENIKTDAGFLAKTILAEIWTLVPAIFALINFTKKTTRHIKKQNNVLNFS
ncbi:hypothetical protein [Treponema zioleckii]|uniref:hypothetical protein n=1 Tax=Treponema zioleckii TaxID=331680 RepID=UPI00168AB0CB|nr:hypothetical protein [Treponema zioleckii]